MMDFTATPIPNGKAATGPQPALQSEQDARAFLRYIIDPTAGCTEVRILNADLDRRRGLILPEDRFPKTIAGYFDDPEAAIQELRQVRGVSVYCTLNPINPALKARSCNRLKPAGKSGAATDKHASCLRYLFLDCDAVRPTGISSTAAELAVAIERRDQILADHPDLAASAIWGQSGNGGWILVRLPDYPNDAGHNGVIERAVAHVAERYSDDRVAIDPVTKNPARIMGIAGCLKVKGDSIPERPHRVATIDSPPGDRPAFDLVAWVEQHTPKPAEPQTKPEPEPLKPWRVKATGGRMTPKERCLAYVFSAGFPESIEGLKGHSVLYRVACEAWDRFGLSKQDTHDVVAEFNQKKTHPPESDKQVAHKVAQAIKNHPTPSLKRLNAELPESNGKHQEGGFVGSAGSSGQESPKFEGDPLPLTVDLLPVPTLDPRMLPAVLRDWLADITDRACVPLEYAAIPALVSLGALVGRRLAIRPKRYDDWYTVPNLWGATIGRPGFMKTSPAEEAMRPLKRLVAEALKAHEQAVAAHNENLMIATVRAAAAKDELKRAAKAKKSDAELRVLAAAAVAPEKQEEPKPKRYIVNDSTVEKLGELLSENPNGLLLFRDELVGFFRSMERQGHESDRGFYLEAWNGLGGYTYDRIGRGTVHIPSVCLSIFGTIQPGPLARYLRGAANGEEADGFMPRFQLLTYPDPPAEFVNVDRYPDSKAKNRAFEVFKAIDVLEPQSRGCPHDDDRNLDYLGFAPKAQTFFDQWRTDLENRLRSGLNNNLLICHMSKYRSLMPSLALLFHLVESIDAVTIPPVSLVAAKMAAAWCDYLEAHARRTYQAALDGDPEIAMHLAERIKQSIPNPFTFRQIAQKGWSGLGLADDVRRAVGILEDRGWVKVVEVPTGPSGGRPSEKVWINPRIREEEPS